MGLPCGAECAYASGAHNIISGCSDGIVFGVVLFIFWSSFFLLINLSILAVSLPFFFNNK